MEQTFADLFAEARGRGPARLAVLWARVGQDALVQGAGARLASRRRALRTAARPRKEARTMSFAIDVRHALRILRMRPAFTAVALSTLALGIGSSAAMFSVVDAILVRSLPYPEAEELVLVKEAGEGAESMWPSFQNFVDWRDGTGAFETMAALTFPASVTVLGPLDPSRVEAVGVTRGFFELLGVRPELGRSFGAWEHRAGAPPAAVVSHGFWRDHLAGAQDLSSVVLEMRGEAHPVVGVMPAGFRLLGDPEVWYALEATGQTSVRGAHWLRVVGRLRDGVSVAAADRDLDRITERIQQAHAGETQAVGARVQPLREVVTGAARKPLLLLMGAALLVLLVACTNVSSMLLARAARRQGEVSVRAALGASRSRIVRQLLSESLVMAALGGVAGTAVAYAALRALIAVAPASLPRLDEVTLDPRALLFTAALSLASVLAFGLAPALWGAGRGTAQRLRSAGAGGVSSHPLWGGLVALEAALAVVLLVGTGLLLRSFANIVGADTGFSAEGVALAEVSLPASRYGTEQDMARFFRLALAEVESLPGVERAGLVTWLPIDSGNYVGPFELEEGRRTEEAVGYRVASGGYFEAVGIELLAGRSFDEPAAPGGHEVVVNRSLAERYWPGENPLGRRMRAPGMDAHPDEWLTVVGMVGEARHWRRAPGSQPEYYVHYAQRASHAGSNAYLVARTEGRPEPLLGALRSRLRAVDADVPVRVSTLASELEGDLVDRRFALLLLSSFAVLALVLTSVGIYGVVAFAVAARAREMGIRLSLGASRERLRIEVLTRSLTSVATGLAAGLAVALGLSRLLRGLLYEVPATDVATLSAAVATVLAAALLASWIPAERAGRVDPAAIVREP
jgi:putative ABC transport system permease protein